MLDFRIPYRIIFSLMHLSAQNCDGLYWVNLSYFYNKRTNFLITTRIATSLGLGWTTRVITQGGGTCLFLVKMAEGKSLCTSHMVNQHDSILRDLLSLPVVSCDKATLSSGLSQSHSNTTRSAHKLYLSPEFLYHHPELVWKCKGG